MNLISSNKLTILTVITFVIMSVLFFYGDTGFSYNDPLILWHLRFPKIIVAFLAGGMLASAGLLLQVFFHNPLAGPDLLGINAGASLGVALAIMGSAFLPAEFSILTIPVMAFLGAMAIFILLMFLVRKNISKISLIILGLLIASFTASTVSVLVNLSTSLQVKNFLSWSMGTFKDVTLENLPIFFGLSVLSLVGLFFIPKKLNQFMIGENYAKSMGMNVKSFKLSLIIICSLLVSIVTAYCGPIVFIGVIAPHLARALMKKSDVRILLPTVFFFGSFLALSSELILVLVPGNFLSTNSLLGLIGAPIIALYLIRDQRRLH